MAGRSPFSDNLGYVSDQFLERDKKWGYSHRGQAIHLGISETKLDNMRAVTLTLWRRRANLDRLRDGDEVTTNWSSVDGLQPAMVPVIKARHSDLRQQLFHEWVVKKRIVRQGICFVFFLRGCVFIGERCLEVGLC